MLDPRQPPLERNPRRGPSLARVARTLLSAAFVFGFAFGCAFDLDLDLVFDLVLAFDLADG